MDEISLQKALHVLGQVLTDKHLHFELVAIGGGGLLLLGIIHRPTKDIDLVARIEDGMFVSAKRLPQSLSQAIDEVGIALDIGQKWMNAGPSDLLTLGLPEGFQSRMITHHFGGLTLHLASRFDQICFKLYATVDQGPDSKHFFDLKALQPTQEELLQAAQWCKTHDVSKTFAYDINEAIAALRG